MAIAHESFLGTFRAPVRHSPDGAIRETDGVFAFVTGLPFSGFNGCIVTAPIDADEVAGALGWVADHGVSYRAWIVDELLPELEHVPARFELELQADPYPAMVLHPAPESPAPAPGVEISFASSSALEEFLHVFESGGPVSDVTRRLFSQSFADDRDVQLLVGRLGGRPVGTAVAIQSASASGVVAVGTLEEARRRGVGTGADMGRSRGRKTAGIRHDRPPVLANGLPCLLGDGLPNSRDLRGLRAVILLARLTTAGAR